MRLRGKRRKQTWTFYFLTYIISISIGEGANCPHPPVPYAATYINITGGPDSSQWKIKYNCDSGYEPFGDDIAECRDGEWTPTTDDLPKCAVNVAQNKPADASSQSDGGHPGNAVDGEVTTVHDGRRCSETLKEKGPWWTVDLLGTYPVDHVKLTTRSRDGFPIKKAEIRVGNSTKPGDNPLCNWIFEAIEPGTTKSIPCGDSVVGRYVTVTMTGVETVLSLCEVQVFSTEGLSPKTICSKDAPVDEVDIFDDSCYIFTEGEVSGYDEADRRCQRESPDFHLLDKLTELSTDYVKARLESRIKAEGGPRSMFAWVGAQRSPDSRRGKEIWNWISDGSEVDEIYIDWGRGQPNNYNQDQNCAVLDSDLQWGWNDISCRISGVAVCRAEFARCPSPPVNQGSMVAVSPRGGARIGDSLTYLCPVGEVPLGETSQTCTKSGTWSGLPIACKPVDCGKVPGLADGDIHILDGRTSWGARVRYKCHENYSLMDGDEERVCTEQGWSGSHPKCVYTKCPEPPFVESADVQIVGPPNTLGSKLVYKCHQGHKASGSLSRECLVGGKWSGKQPVCEFVDCGDPPRVENGKLQLLDGRTTYGAEYEASCQADYLPVGDGRQRCEGSGRWTRNPFSCEIIKCPPPVAPRGGRVAGYNREVHGTIEFSCLEGHILEGEDKAFCTRDGVWSSRAPTCRYVECPRIRRPKSGTVHLVNGTAHIGSLVRYTCDRSHSLVGLEERACLPTGRWSGDPPKCSEIRCKTPPTRNNTIVSVSSTERLHGTSVLRNRVSMKVAYRVGSVLKYRCKRGFLLQVSLGPTARPASEQLRVTTRRCTTTGEWTGSPPTCKYVDCGMPPAVENSDYFLANNITGTSLGSVVTYKCNDHFKLDGSERLTCGSKYSWEPAAPTCVETLCDEIEPKANGTMVLTTRRIGGKATFSCDEGFKLTGPDHLECLSSGSWTSYAPSCILIDCGEPLPLDNGRVYKLNSTTINSVIEHHCLPGFERDGPFERVCLEDGYWSGVEPSCQKPRPVLTIFSDNTVDGTSNVQGGDLLQGGGGGGTRNPEEAGGAGLYIGIALGLIVVVGLMILGIYFYRKQKAITSKPPPAPYRDRNANGIPGYTTALYNGGSSNGSNMGPSLGQRPPPPIQMYSMDDSGQSGSGMSTGGHPMHHSHLQPPPYPPGGPGGPNGHLHNPAEDHRGPIYDTINDDSTSGGTGASGYSSGVGPGAGSSDQGSSNMGPTRPFPPLPPVAPPVVPQQSTFSPNSAPINSSFVQHPTQPPPQPPTAPVGGVANGGGAPQPPNLSQHVNGGYSHDYDVPEGSDRSGSAAGQKGPQGQGVTINGIAV